MTTPTTIEILVAKLQRAAQRARDPREAAVLRHYAECYAAEIERKKREDN